MKKSLLFSLLTLFSLSGYAQIKINEIMPSNVSAVLDDAYNYSMWAEIYNPGTISYNLASFYFTDDKTEPTKWTPASQIISAGGYKVLWFERPERTGHANFKLAPEGGHLYIYNKALQLVDSVKYPQQFRNVSYGRKTDGSNDWVFFEAYSNGTSNNAKKYATIQCSDPVISKQAGFYSGSQTISFTNPVAGDSIFYTLNGAEPNRKSTYYKAGTTITLSKTSMVRARTFAATKLPSNINTNTFLIGERDFHLPVVSIVTTQANLTDNTIGIYVQGTNGITGNGMDTPANWNQDWDRPANIEIFDTAHTQTVNQEADIRIAGAWSRMNGEKSLVINPNKKFGKTEFDYDFFKANKPGMKYRSFLFRNSGNDFFYSMMRDGLMQSLVSKRMDIDYTAYEPAVCFMNGVYYGIQNIRERSNEDYVYSNYGYDADDIKLIETWDMSSDTSFTKVSNYAANNDMTQSSVYNNLCNMIDIESFINYYMTEIYYGNTDWPGNNIKVWKKKVAGKWRWILYDTDFGYSLYNTSLYNENSLQYALGELSSNVPAEWSTLMLRRMVLNDTFRQRFIDRFCIHISSTFEYNRSVHIIDSLAAKIRTEISYHKSKWGSYRDFESDISNMKTFAQNRPDAMLSFLGARFLNTTSTRTIGISANQPHATYTFNGENIIDSAINLKYFAGQQVKLKANNSPGYEFQYWELNGSGTTNTLIASNSNWKYFDGANIPATNWMSSTYDDSSWKSGVAQLGYGGKGETTTISYGNDANNKYITAYFRKTFTIDNLSNKQNFSVSAFVDDGAVVYINGTEVGRYNLPAGTIDFSTVTTNYNNGETATFAIPSSLLQEGTNVVAVEVHQTSASSSDLIFNLQLTCSETQTAQIVSNAEFSTTLTDNFNIKAIYNETSVGPESVPAVKINEVVSSNSIFQDDYMDTDDYIELYNDENEAVDIAGWYITDTPVNQTFYQIPETDHTQTTIPAKSWLMLWADSDPAQGVLHLGFKLSKSGEKIILSKKDENNQLAIVDSVTVPALEQNISFSRIPDGTGEWVVKDPTPGETNGMYNATPVYGINQLRIYPTAVSSHLTIENAGGKSVRIIDLTGKIIVQKQCTSATETLNMESLHKGIYLVQIEGSVWKIIKL